MHVCQATCNVGQLNRESVRLSESGDRGVAYKLNAVCMSVLLNELIDVPILHPLGDHGKSALTHRHSKQW